VVRRHQSRVLAHDATELRVLDWTLWKVSKYYVEPGRIDPHAMTLAALEALEKEIAEVLVEPLAGGKRARVRVGTAEREFQIGDVEALWAVGPHVREVFRFIDRNTELTEDDQRKAEYAIVAGVLGTLDPHTNLLRPDDFEDMKASTKGSFGGLGIEVGMREGQITVIRVIDDNPAADAGMKAGDRIVQIDAESTVTLSLNECVGRLRGPPGSPVTVYVSRAGKAEPLPIKVTRATIRLDSVIGDVLVTKDAAGKEERVGLIQIPRNFAQTTGKELRKKLEEFEKEGVSGVILDLRDNPGGLLNAAVEVADAFLSAGTIVSTVGVASPREESRADDRYDFADLPMVVLIDQGSASASEIVAGALRNLGRAVLMGRRSFGKGSVQVLHERKVGDKELALKLTIAQYLTPGDVSIQSVGVSPDLETVPVWVGEDHIAYFGRERFDMLREEQLAAHLESRAAKTQRIEHGPLYFLDRGSVDPDKPRENKDDAARLKDKAEAKAERTPLREGDKEVDADARTKILLEDPEVRLARDFILWAPSTRREDLLPKMSAFVDEQKELEAKRIAGSLTARGIDWSKGPKPTTGAPRLLVKTESNKTGNVIKGGETGTVTVTVENKGDAPAYMVRAITDSDYRYFDERELLFGRIEPGTSKKYSLKLSVGEHELSRTDRIDFHLFEQHGAKLAAGSKTSIDISAEGLSRPQFAYGYQILDMPKKGTDVVGNGDGALQVGERVRMRVDVTNTGEGPALDTWLSLRNLSGEAVFLHSGRKHLEKIASGESRTVELDVEIKKRPEGGDARLQLAVTDSKVGEALSEKLVFPVRSEGVELSDGGKVMEAGAAVDLYASPIKPLRVVARADAGTRFKSTGEAGDWVRLDLGDGDFAFARKGQLNTSSAGRTKGKPAKHVLEVSPPQVALIGTVTQTEDESISLSGKATDDEAVRDVFITIFNPSRNLFGSREKVFYQASTDPTSGSLEFAADVPLTPGNNLIEVHARENDDVVTVRRMWVLRTSGLAEARAKDAEFTTSGQLRVDTFK
ncbi:MAG: MXAN_5808 family serine peptidase, partial [Myxococcota bacterium]